MRHFKNMFIDVHTFLTHISHVLSSLKFKTQKQSQISKVLVTCTGHGKNSKHS